MLHAGNQISCHDTTMRVQINRDPSYAAAGAALANALAGYAQQRAMQQQQADEGRWYRLGDNSQFYAVPEDDGNLAQLDATKDACAPRKASTRYFKCMGRYGYHWQWN